MVTTNSINRNDKVLLAITSELDDFEERYNEGILIAEEEWNNWSYDWHGLFYSYISSLVNHSNELTNAQRVILIDLIKRTKELKKKILEKGYEYPEVVDRVEVSLL